MVSLAAAANWLDPDWSAALSIAVAVSFVVAAPISGATHNIYRKYRDKLLTFQSATLVDSFEPTDNVKIVILGMGRVGTGAYEALAPRWGRQVLGVEAIESRVKHHVAEQRRVVLADASNPDFWFRLKFGEIQMIMLALTNHSENMLVADLLSTMGFKGELAAVVRHEDHAEEMHAKGISAFNLYAQAGTGFAAHACAMLEPEHASQGAQ